MTALASPLKVRIFCGVYLGLNCKRGQVPCDRACAGVNGDASGDSRRVTHDGACKNSPRSLNYLTAKSIWMPAPWVSRSTRQTTAARRITLDGVLHQTRTSVTTRLETSNSGLQELHAPLNLTAAFPCRWTEARAAGAYACRRGSLWPMPHVFDK